MEKITKSFRGGHVGGHVQVLSLIQLISFSRHAWHSSRYHHGMDGSKHCLGHSELAFRLRLKLRGSSGP